MKTYHLARAVFVSLLLLGVATTAQGQIMNEPGVQVLTRGPVHEAFAEASMTGTTMGAVIRRTPYDPITELPPEHRPEGANVAWIPGYWNWDDDRDDFIWASGVWRDLPPGRQWVPGYWAPVRGGSQWISGFWGDVAQTELTYLPAPPEPLEAGPTSRIPGPGHIWAPGNWVWQQTRYDWQPGYWVVQQPDWIWCPARYTWTPRGYVYVPGYWDYDITRRGVMFAPVYYSQPVYRRPNYYYSPSTVIDLAVMLTNLFVQPRSHHYYYGDYYDRRYEQRGFYPWYSKQVRRYGDDPIYSHYRSRQLRQDPDWDRHIDEQYKYRRQHVDARPPRTLDLQVNVSSSSRRVDSPDRAFLGRSLTEAIQGKTLPHRFTPVNMDERKQIESRGREVHKYQSERARLETPKAPEKPQRRRDIEQPVRVPLRVSPVAARVTERTEDTRTPPAMPAVPKPRAVERRGRQEDTQRVEAGRTRPGSNQDVRRQESKPDDRRNRAEAKEEKDKREQAPDKRDNKNRRNQKQ